MCDQLLNEHFDSQHRTHKSSLVLSSNHENVIDILEGTFSFYQHNTTDNINFNKSFMLSVTILTHYLILQPRFSIFFRKVKKPMAELFIQLKIIKFFKKC